MTTEESITEALETAQIRDEEREKAALEGRLDTLGTLHGVPISVKDHILQKGHSWTVGCTFKLNQPKSKFDSISVGLLRD